MVIKILFGSISQLVIGGMLFSVDILHSPFDYQRPYKRAEPTPVLLIGLTSGTKTLSLR